MTDSIETSESEALPWAPPGAPAAAAPVTPVRAAHLDAAPTSFQQALANMFERNCVAMAAAVIDARRHGPAEGMRWIVNTLAGPGLLPDIECTDAQAYFELHAPSIDACCFVSRKPAVGAAEAVPATFQARVKPWLLECFGELIAGDRQERNHRFLEEAVELVQACGCTRSEAHQLVDYVFDRPVGEIAQEAGGVMTTLAALCLAQGLDMHAAGEVELARIWTKVEQIRAKQAAKPKHSPLPAAPELGAGHAVEPRRLVTGGAA